MVMLLGLHNKKRPNDNVAISLCMHAMLFYRYNRPNVFSDYNIGLSACRPSSGPQCIKQRKRTRVDVFTKHCIWFLVNNNYSYHNLNILAARCDHKSLKFKT